MYSTSFYVTTNCGGRARAQERPLTVEARALRGSDVTSVDVDGPTGSEFSFWLRGS